MERPPSWPGYHACPPGRNATWSRSRVAAVLGVLLVLAFVTLVRVNLVGIPFERDEGDYFYLGQLILDGKTPYVSFYEQKLPGLFYAYALIILAFGSTVEGAHLAFLVVNVVTTIGIFFAARRLYGDLPAAVAGAAFAILALAPRLCGFTTQSEHLVALLVTAGILPMLHARPFPRRLHLFLSGLAFGLAFLIKPNAIFFGVFGAFTSVVGGIRRPLRWRELAGAFAAYVLGFAVPCALALFAIAIQGALDDMWYWAYEVPRHYVSRYTLAEGLKVLRPKWERIREHYSAFWLAVGAGLVLPLFVNGRRREMLFLWPLATCSILSVVPGYRFFGHYWIQVLPAAALLIAASADSVRCLLTRWVGRGLAGTVVLSAFGVMVLHNLYAQREYYFFPNYSRVLRDVYGVNPFPEMMVVGQFIKDRTTEGDQIVVLGSEPQLYFYTGRRAPTPHHYLTFLMTDRHRFPRNAVMQEEFVRQVTAALPKYMVFVGVGVSWLGNADSDRTILSWFEGFAARYYTLVGLADMITPSETRYVWDDAVSRYQRRGQNYVLVYERRG